MKIVWLVNIIMPELAEHLGQKPGVFGGWLSGALEAVRAAGHELVVCTTSRDAVLCGRYEVAGVTYHVVLRGDLSAVQESFRLILAQEQPDVIHIYGTEFEHAWAMAKCAHPGKILVTVQGALTYYANAAYAGLPERVCRDNGLHKILRALHKGGQSIELQRKSFLQRAALEQKVLRHVKYVNGGSDWGNAVARSLSPDVRTLDCGLILREPFYTEERWSWETCEKHSIYALYSYPIKGFHKLLDAMPTILHEYPDARIYAVANRLPWRSYKGWKAAIMDAAPDYNWLIQKKIEELKLRDHIVFAGYLDAVQVKARLLRSQVFVSASAIENQSTALGEAMILGVPSVASCVGAMLEMIDHGEDGFLYPFDEPYLLADAVCRIFADRDLAERFSRRGHEHAERTYDREENGRRLLNMYETILRDEENAS